MMVWNSHVGVTISRLIKLMMHIAAKRKRPLQNTDLKVFAISNHLVGQAITDRIDQRHKSILPAYVWGDGDPEGVRQRAANEMVHTAEAAKRLGVTTVNGFTGSPIWHLIYSFPPVTPAMIDEGYADFAARLTPVLDKFHELGILFALEVHPTEIAFDIASARRTLKALNNHPISDSILIHHIWVTRESIM